MKLDDLSDFECAQQGFIKGGVGECIICGAPTRVIDICAEARFCSTECVDAFYDMMKSNVTFDEEEF